MTAFFNSLFNTIVNWPIAWTMNLIFQLVRNYGVSIFIITLIVRLVLLPSSIKQQKGMAKTARMQPKIAKLQKKYANNKQKLSEEMNALYMSEGSNPMMSGCLPMLIQFPIMIGLYTVIYRPLTYIEKVPAEILTKAGEALQSLGLVSAPNANGVEMIIIREHEKLIDKVPELAANVNFEQLRNNFSVFGLDLTLSPDIKSPSIIWIIPILAGLASFLMSWLSVRQQKKNNPAMAMNGGMNGCMTIGMPLFSLYIAFSVPGGVGFYWICSSIIAIFQQLLMYKFYSPKKIAAELLIEEAVERRSKEEYKKKLIK